MRSLARTSVIVLIAAGNLLAIFMLWKNYDSTILKGWDCDYPLLIGNEASGDRPWIGRIRGLAMYATGLAASDVKQLSGSPLTEEGVELRQSLGALLFYNFDAAEDNISPQLLPTVPTFALEYPGEPGAWALEDGALSLKSPTVLKLSDSFRSLCEAIVRERAFTAEIEIARPGPPQGGPARILSSSASPLLRNFTLGEEYGVLVLRIRTPWTGENGERLALTSESEVLSANWSHVVFGFQSGSAFMFVDGAPATPPIDYSRYYRLNDDPHYTLAAPLAALAIPLFAVIGLLSGLVAPREGLPDFALYAAACIVLPLLAAIGLPIIYGAAINWPLLAAMLFSAVLGVALARLLPSGWRL